MLLEQAASLFYNVAQGVRAEQIWYYGRTISTQAAGHLGRTSCRSTSSSGIGFIKVRGCLDVRSCLEELSYIEPGTRVMMKSVSALKEFRISEILGSVLVCFPTPTIQIPGCSATTNHFFPCIISTLFMPMCL